MVNCGAEVARVGMPFVMPSVVMYQGDASGRNKITLTNIDADGEPVDLTVFGDEWACWARNVRGEVGVLDVDSTQAAVGVLEVSVPDGDAEGLLPYTSYEFDVQVRGGTVSPLTVFRGSFEVEEEVTEGA